MSNNMDTGFAGDSSDHDSADDFIPLSKLLKKPQAGDKQLHGSKGLDDTSDGEALVPMAKASRSAKKPVNKKKKSGSTSGTGKKKTDPSALDSSDDDVPLTTVVKKQKEERPTISSKAALTKDDDVKEDESSEDEPLIKKPKVSSKAAKETRSLSTKKGADKKESFDDDVSSDEEPLSKRVKRLNLQHQTRPRGTPPRNASLAKKRKTKVPRKKVQYHESSSDRSDDEPLMKLKKKTKKSLSEEKVSANGRNTKPKAKDQIPKDPSSSDDEVPLVNLIGKQGEPAGKESKPEKAKQTSKAARKRREPSDESSDDEPLVNLAKKTPRDVTTPTTKAKTSKKKTPAKKQPAKAPVSRKSTGSATLSKGSPSNSSDDEALIKTVHNPQVRKILRVILERCSVEQLRATGCLNTTSTVPVAEEMVEADSDPPEDSP